MIESGLEIKLLSILDGIWGISSGYLGDAGLAGALVKAEGVFLSDYSRCS